MNKSTTRSKPLNKTKPQQHSAKRTIATRRTALKAKKAPKPLLTTTPQSQSRLTFTTSTTTSSPLLSGLKSNKKFTPLTHQQQKRRFAVVYDNGTKAYMPTSSKYLNWVNAPPNLHWKQVADFFRQQGYPVKADQDPAAPTFFRVKFETMEACQDAYQRLNQYHPPNHKEPLDLRFGRSFRTEGTKDDLVPARLRIISGPINLAWTVIKDSLQAYTPILSVDQVSSSTYKIRFFTRNDYNYVLENLSKKRVQTPIGQEIVFELRPWVAMTPNQATTAQDLLVQEWKDKGDGEGESKIILNQINEKKEALAGAESIPELPQENQKM